MVGDLKVARQQEDAVSLANDRDDLSLGHLPDGMALQTAHQRNGNAPDRYPSEGNRVCTYPLGVKVFQLPRGKLEHIGRYAIDEVLRQDAYTVCVYCRLIAQKFQPRIKAGC